MSGVGEGGQQRVQDLIDDGVLVVGDGYRAKRVELADEGLPFARAANIDGGFHFDGAELLGHEGIERAGHKLSVPGDVVFTSKGTVGRFALVRDETPPFAYSPQLCFWRSTDPDTLDPGYLFYWMQSDAFLHQVHAVKGQTDMADYVSLRDQRRMRVDVPPVEDQREIAAVLGALDARIDVNRRMNRTLEATAQALFHERFVAPLAAGGAVPDGWRVGSLSEIARLQTKTVQPRDEPEAVWEHYSLPAFDEAQRPVYDLGSTIKSGKYRVPPTSVLVSKMNPRFPRVWMPDVQDVQVAIGSTEFMPFVPIKTSWHNFVYNLMRSKPVEQALQSRATGSTTSRQRVRPRAIEMMEIAIPPISLIEEFGREAGPLHRRRFANLRQSQVLAEARDALLPELVSGRLRVPGRGGAVEAV